MTEPAVSIIAFCCNWCSYAGADLAGTSRLAYPHNVKIIKVPCSCRVDPIFVLRAFGRGADGVIICGCHPGDCHYSTGNYFARKRFALMFSLLEFMGIEPQRMRLEWISAAEAQKFARVMNDFTETIMTLGPNTRLIDPRNRVQSPELGDCTQPQPYSQPYEYPPINPNYAAKIEEIEAKMKQRAKELLSSGEVDRIVAWKRGDFELTGGYTTHPEPASFHTPDAVDEMVYNRFCVANLSKYLMDSPWLGDRKFEGKTGVFLRPCDSHSMARMMAEHVVDKDKKHIIGIACGGTVAVDEMVEIGLFEKCQVCTKTDHAIFDEIIDIAGVAFDRPSDNPLALVDTLDALTSEERYAYWQSQLAKCIRCNACRNTCPVCNCKKCVFSSGKFDMATKANTTDFEGQMFHATRALHVAERCTDCGECSRVCPQGIPLHLLNRKIIKDIEAKGDEIWTPQQSQ